jgi:hypothetical protein
MYSQLPKVGNRYRLKSATLAISSQEGLLLHKTIPAGGVVLVVGGRMEEARMAVVEWEGRILTMFARDLNDRGELVEGN